MKNTSIEWADHTFNPWSGCTKVSPGCANCYAETLAKRAPKTLGGWGAGAPRRRTSEKYWKQPLRWNAEQERRMDVLTPGMARIDYPLTRPRVFCASLADWLDDEVPVAWLADLMRLIWETPNLDWLLLTKRPENFERRMNAAYLAQPGATGHSLMMARWTNGIQSTPPANVWIGTTVEDQPRADERIPAFLRIPARVHFLSGEPLLGPVDLRLNRADRVVHQMEKCAAFPGFAHAGKRSLIDWVICGGESGPKARPMHPDWARSLRDQCAGAGVAFFFKQWGEWAPGVARLKRYDPANPDAYVNEVRWCSTGGTVVITERTKERNLTTPEREPHRFENGEILTYRVGKSEAGRLLDGVEHNAVPKA